MTLEKAIEILTSLSHTPPSGATRDLIGAVKLGIEAMKRIQYDREWGAAVSRKLLPGETKE